MKLIKHFVNGKLYDGASERKSKIFDPSTGEQSGEVILASKKDLNLAVENAKKAFKVGPLSHHYKEQEYYLNLKS